jgi:hypothetical protein
MRLSSSYKVEDLTVDKGDFQSGHCDYNYVQKYPQQGEQIIC